MTRDTVDRPAPLHALDDGVLIRGARDGSVAAFDLLMERHYDRVVGFLARRTMDEDVTADLAQETFLQAFEQLARFDGQHAFAAWLYGIARHRLQRHQHRLSARRVLSLDWPRKSTMAPPSALQQADASKPCQEQELIDQVLAALTPPLREVLLFNCEDGFTAVEIAQILDISQSAAERRLSRAKQQFRAEYIRLNGAAPC